FFFQAEDGIRDKLVTGVQTCALPILPECLHSTIDVLLERTVNVLSVIHPHVYFPTFSNSLKDVGRFLGFERTNENATGLQCIVRSEERRVGKECRYRW